MISCFLKEGSPAVPPINWPAVSLFKKIPIYVDLKNKYHTPMVNYFITTIYKWSVFFSEEIHSIKQCYTALWLDWLKYGPLYTNSDKTPEKQGEKEMETYTALKRLCAEDLTWMPLALSASGIKLGMKLGYLK